MNQKKCQNTGHPLSMPSLSPFLPLNMLMVVIAMSSSAVVEGVSLQHIDILIKVTSHPRGISFGMSRLAGVKMHGRQ